MMRQTNTIACYPSTRHHDFENIESLRKGVEPKRWKWLWEHKRECHLNDKGDIADGAKTWTDTKLESSTLFEVPKEILVMM